MEKVHRICGEIKSEKIPNGRTGHEKFQSKGKILKEFYLIFLVVDV